MGGGDGKTNEFFTDNVIALLFLSFACSTGHKFLTYTHVWILRRGLHDARALAWRREAPKVAAATICQRQWYVALLATGELWRFLGAFRLLCRRRPVAAAALID